MPLATDKIATRDKAGVPYFPDGDMRMSTQVDVEVDSEVDAQVEAKCRLVLSVLTAIVLLGAMAETIAIDLQTSSSDVEFYIVVFGLLFLLVPLSPYVFLLLFLCRSRVVTAAHASGLLFGSVAISGFGVLMIWCNVAQSNDALRGLWLLITPVPQWIAAALLVAGIEHCARSVRSEQDHPQEPDDTSE